MPYRIEYSSFSQEVKLTDALKLLLQIREPQELLVGAMSLSSRIERVLACAKSWNISPHNGIYLFSPTVCLSFSMIEEIFRSSGNVLWVTVDKVPVACSLAEVSEIPPDFDFQSSLWAEIREVSMQDIIHFSYIEDLLEANPTWLRRDIEWLSCHEQGEYSTSLSEGVICHLGAHVHPQVVFDTRGGPIYIADGVEIQAFSYLEGPCFISEHAKIFQAQIRSSYIGAHCHVGGEVDNTIMLDYTNKAHEGFIGHSYIGSWVNMGALSTTSDLKNNYSTVSLEYYGEMRRTASLKLGSMIGDFTTLSIGTLLGAGSIIGIGCNLALPGEGAPKFLPSFTWKTSKETTLYRWSEFLSTLRTRMERRQYTLLPEYEQKLLSLHSKIAENI